MRVDMENIKEISCADIIENPNIFKNNPELLMEYIDFFYLEEIDREAFLIPFLISLPYRFGVKIPAFDIILNTFVSNEDIDDVLKSDSGGMSPAAFT
ncbi:MAG: hypothetical protein ACP5RZ_06375, partial [Thermoplasmata archaeon]